MKHISLYIIALLLIACTACDKFLEEDPTGRIPDNEAYSTEGELYRNAVLSLYTLVGGNANSQGLQGTGMTVVFGKTSLLTSGEPATEPLMALGTICSRLSSSATSRSSTSMPFLSSTQAMTMRLNGEPRCVACAQCSISMPWTCMDVCQCSPSQLPTWAT